MPPKLKEFIRDWLPPALLRAMRGRGIPGLPRGIEFTGDYASWQDASSHAGSYAESHILEKSRDALLKVVKGEAACERDTVVFDHVEYSYPLLANLLHVASLNDNRLGVLDFGGALGSSYYQNRAYLSHLAKLRWSVVEQLHFVQCGRQYFATESLHFHESAEEAVRKEGQPDVLLLSSVLQYLEDSAEMLRRLLDLRIKTIIVDRAPVLFNAPTRLTVQVVPPSIYPASYPCRLYNERDFIGLFEQKYKLMDQFDATIGSTITLDGAAGRYRGYLFNLR